MTPAARRAAPHETPRVFDQEPQQAPSTPAVVQYDDGGGGGASGGSGDRAQKAFGGRAQRAWDDDDELIEGSVTQMVVTDVRPDA